MSEAILAELRAIRALLEQALAPRTADAQLVAAIRAHVNDSAFTATQLIEEARMPAFSTLAAAIGELNGRKLGQRLKAIEGCDFSGIAVQRIGSGSTGAIWRVSQRSNPATISATPPTRSGSGSQLHRSRS